MVRELEGKIAAVTGAASGIGLASTEAMALPARVVMIDRDKTVLQAIQARHGDTVIPLVTDSSIPLGMFGRGNERQLCAQSRT